eukprot:9677209-Alexandrium_andersonii.AAC.1
MTVEVPRPPRHQGTAPAAGMVSNAHVQPVPRGMTMPTETMGAQVRASPSRGASQRGNGQPQPPAKASPQAPPAKAPPREP